MSVQPPLRYLEQRPPADLAPWIASFWRITGVVNRGAFVAHRILPDGCADIIIDLRLARQRVDSSSAELIGPASTAAVVTLEGRIDYLGVRLRPGVVGTVAGMPAGELRDRRVSAADRALPLTIDVNQLATTPRGQQLTMLIAAFRHRIASLERPDPRVSQAIELWRPCPPRPYPLVSAVAREVALSERAFERRFVSQVGLTPVEFRRLARFRSVLRRHGAGLRRWAALAALEGFSDQAHLSREFQAFSGLAPGAWARTQGIGAGFFQDSEVTSF